MCVCMSADCNVHFSTCVSADATTEKPQIQTPVSAAKSVESDVVEILI